MFEKSISTPEINQLNLTSQTAGVIEVVTNKETNRKRATNINNWRIILRKPRTLIKQDNIKVLQVLDLLNNFERISEKPLESGVDSIIKYIDDVDLDRGEVNDILANYPKDTIIKATKSGVYDALTRG